MDTLFQDLRYGVRMLARNRAFTVVAVLALALGIGANTAIFSVVYSILLKPLPYKDADRLAVANISIPDYRDLKEASQVFDETAIWASNLYSLSANGEAEQVLGAVVSPSFFTMLGQAAIGRVFGPEEERERLAVLSYDLWQRRFGGDTGALGQTIDLGGRVHTIIGVMPREFQFPSSQFKLWVPLESAMDVAPQQANNRQLRIFRVLAHLKPGVSFTQAQAEADAIAERLEQQYPDTNAGAQIRFAALYERIVGDARPGLIMLFGTVGFVLLIACANVANLMLARTTVREREIAIRTALGAGRWRVSRQLLTESMLLSAIGGVLGVLLAVWGIDALKAVSPADVPRLSAISISLPVLLFTFAVSLLTGALFGLVPAFHASRVNLNTALKEGGRGVSGNRWGRRLRGALVIVEIALSLVVLIGAGLLVKSFAELAKVDPGFVADNLLTMNIELFRFKDPQRRAVVARECVSRLEQIPGVQAAGCGTGLPPVTPQRGTRFAIEGMQIEPGDDTSYFMAVTPNYFRALGTPLIEGRAFNDADREGGPLVAIINQSLARTLFPDENPVGKHLKLINPEESNDWRTIVGVVGDVKYSGLDDSAQAAIYTPFPQTPFLWAYVMVRTESDAANFAASIRSAVSSADPSISAINLQPMRNLVSESVARPRFQMMLFSTFALLALILATVGLYGVMSYLVTERTREIGVRMALGAQPSDVLRMVVGQGMLLATVGCALGIAGALAFTRLMSSLLYGVSATDPATFAAVALLLLGVALGACFVPARRATRVDPMVALRYE
ncbi:MAG TPA: ABC transporter permease [Blastocatellia bacterium]|nr:ABC transporter permease [Blastocatellia bacterium]